jgi:Fe2+ or Zn2+ uptake regulation protein
VTSDIFNPEPDLTSRLRERGQRVTSQRLLIHDALRDLGRHATADEVMSAVSPRLPSVSLPTIYATLELLEELELVRRVRAGSGPTLWDPRIEPHHHLSCRRCGRVEDVEADFDAAGPMEAARRAGFAPEGIELLVSGLCAQCARS